MPILVRSFSPDVSTSLCLKTLQLLWDSRPYSQDVGLIYSLHAYTKELSRAAISRKFWLVGDPDELENCAQLLHRSIRGALVRLSPYYRLMWYNADPSDIANAVEDMLRIDSDISAYTKGRETLTECAVR